MIDNLDLPPCLERVDGGIRCTGHRVSLFLIVDAAIDDIPISELVDRYPTIPEEQLRDVVNFCRRNWLAVLEYHGRLKAESEVRMARYKSKVPGSDELRRRWEQRHGRPFDEMIQVERADPAPAPADDRPPQ